MGASNYLELQIGNHLLRSGSWTKPTQEYVALFLTMPDEDNVGGVEPSASTYARVEYGPGDAYWSEPDDGSGEFANLFAITFPEPGAEAWGDIVGYGLFDQAGNLVTSKTLAAMKTVNAGAPAPEFNPGALRITIA